MKIAESIYNGLTNLGSSIERAKEKQVELNRENLEIGFFPDEEKLRILKYQLYRDVRAGKDVSELRKTISLISNEIDKDRDYENSPITQLNKICRLWLLLGASAIVISFLATGLGCPYQSKFCADTASISNTIIRYFIGE